MAILFSQEEALEAYAEETRRDTKRETEKETATRLIQKGKMTLEEISECISSLSFDDIKKLATEIPKGKMMLEEISECVPSLSSNDIKKPAAEIPPANKEVKHTQEIKPRTSDVKEAISETIRICKDRNVLREYLEEKESEVIDIMMTMLDQERAIATYIEEIKRETERETEKETAARLIQKGKMTLEEISECVPSLSFNDIKKLAAEIAPAN